MSYVALKRLNPNHPVVVTLEVLLHLSYQTGLCSLTLFSLDLYSRSEEYAKESTFPY